MALLIDSVVRRYMKGTSGFTMANGSPAIQPKLQLASDEQLIGWYRNPPPWENFTLLFTTKGIWIEWPALCERIQWRDIVDYESPNAKENVTGIRIRVRDGFRFLRAAGSHGADSKCKDHMALMMILRAVLRSRDVHDEFRSTSTRNSFASAMGQLVFIAVSLAAAPAEADAAAAGGEKFVEAGAGAASGLTTLYRAVSEAELIDIGAGGGSDPAPARWASK